MNQELRETISDRNIPSLSLLVDQLTMRIEWAEMLGCDDECAALRSARETIVGYALGIPQARVSMPVEFHERPGGTRGTSTMTDDTYTTGERVSINAVAFQPDETGVVTDPANGNPTFTVTVLTDREDCRYPFRPDELSRAPLSSAEGDA